MEVLLIAEGSTRWQRFIRHWGISFLIGDDVLFDTFGDAGVFSRNVRRAGIDPEKIRHIIISHDHWDHVAGLWPFLERHKNVTVYLCPGFSRETKERIDSLGARVVEAAGPLEIKSGIYATGQIKGVYAGQDIYEQAVVVKTARGAALITGCAHPGIAAIVDEAKRHFPEPVFLIAGGFHLKGASKDVIEETIRRLKCAGVQEAVPLHCTGAAAQAAFQRAFADGYVALKIGNTLKLE